MLSIFKKKTKKDIIDYFSPYNNMSIESSDPEIRYLKSNADHKMLKQVQDQDLPLIINYKWANEGLKELYLKRLRNSRN